MNARRLLHWTDLEARRRSRPWPRRLAVAAGLTALVAYRGLPTYHTLITLSFAVAMIATSLSMFWRSDAALLSRLPIPGPVLLQAAIYRAARTALITFATLALAAIPLLPDPSLLRALALTATLSLITATLIPAAAATAALVVAGGQAQKAATQLSGTDRLPTTVLGALPGTAAAFAILLAIALRPWLLTGESTAIGPPSILLPLALLISLSSLALISRHSHGMSVAMREVAALDRQRLAHLEIHPTRGLERLVARSLPRPASLVYDRTARLMRRRYPMAWVVGFLAYLVAIPLAIWPPTDALTYALATSIATGVYALTLASRLSRPPIELRIPLPIPPSAASHARIAWILLYIALFSAAPVALATRSVTGSGVFVTLAITLTFALLSAAFAHRQRAA